MFLQILISLYINVLVCLYCFCDITNVTNCSSNICDNSTNVDFYLQINESATESENETFDDYFNFNFTALPTPMHIVSNNRTLTNRKNNVQKIKAEVCLCDLTMASCDINCCCDEDCNDFNINVFSHCKEHEAKVYDSRYCYKQDFIVQNNTKFVHEKIAENLFCIVYDNLPPRYNPRDNMVYDLKLLKRDINNIEKSSVKKWLWNPEKLKPAINMSSSYQSGDFVWKFEGKFLKVLEFAQTGFTSHCTLKKSIAYLDDWEESCLQNDLTNRNKQLFVRNFNNFSILSSPLFLKMAYNLMSNQTCPANICVPLTNYYCADSWEICTTKESRGFCFNQTCENIVKSVKYLIRHNGTAGIIKASAFFKLANISSAFFQRIEVKFEWTDFDEFTAIKRSGNPGYLFGKPIMIGTSQLKTTGKTQIKYVTVSKDNRYLTLPYSGKNGLCKDSSRYNIEFGEDAKTGCAMIFKTNNFSSNTCYQMQNRTLEIMFQQLTLNSSEKNPSRTFISKYGNVLDDNIANWTQILFDKIPKNVAQGYVYQDEIRCENMITSMKVHILHSLISKPEGTNNHLVHGVWIEFANETRLTWPKCLGNNCVDTMKMNLYNYVIFHDATKPSKFQFVVGPNLDIRLPYDFFYPFVSKSNQIKPYLLTILISFFIYRM